MLRGLAADVGDLRPAVSLDARAQVRLDPVDTARIDAIAAHLGITRGEALRVLVLAGLERRAGEPQR